MSPPGKEAECCRHGGRALSCVKQQGLGTLSASLHGLPRLPVQLWETPPTSRPSRPAPSVPPRHWPRKQSLRARGKGVGLRPRRSLEGATTHGGGAARGVQEGEAALAPRPLHWGAGKPLPAFPSRPALGPLAKPSLWRQDPREGRGGVAGMRARGFSTYSESRTHAASRRRCTSDPRP